MPSAGSKITTTGKLRWPGDDSDIAQRMYDMFADGTFDTEDYSPTGIWKHRFDDDFCFEEHLSKDQFVYHHRKFLAKAIVALGGQGGFIDYFF